MNSFKRGYHRKQGGSIKSDLIEIAGAFAVALLLAWAMLTVMGAP
jgi:hypothetical protein